MPGATSVSTEAGMLMSMRSGEVVENPEEGVMVGFARDKVIADI